MLRRKSSCDRAGTEAGDDHQSRQSHELLAPVRAAPGRLQCLVRAGAAGLRPLSQGAAAGHVQHLQQRIAVSCVIVSTVPYMGQLCTLDLGHVLLAAMSSPNAG